MEHFLLFMFILGGCIKNDFGSFSTMADLFVHYLGQKLWNFFQIKQAHLEKVLRKTPHLSLSTQIFSDVTQGHPKR